MIAQLLNDQTERLEKQIENSKDLVLSTVEAKMDNILEESERRIGAKLREMETAMENKLSNLHERISKLESVETHTLEMENHISKFTDAVNTQMDELTNRMDANFKLIQENTEKLAGAQPSDGICPNEGRLKIVEGTVDEVGQEHRNFSLILTGLGFNYQNAAGIVGFARDVLGCLSILQKLRRLSEWA